MLKPERYAKIVQLVNEAGAATVDELSEALNVSKATIRRDLIQLGEDKVILRTHGGAMKYDKTLTGEVPIYLRMHMQKEEKEQVAAEAAKLISEGSTIFICAGTTGRALAGKLTQFHHLTIVTNDIDVAKEISCTDNSLIVVGGQLKSSSSTLCGFFAEEMIKELRVDMAFMAADAVDLETGFMDFGIDEISIKRLLLSVSSRTIMMCDISKFEKPAFVNICPFSAVHSMVTNENTDPVTVAALRETGLQVILAPSKN
jgi:DeoR family transcriptional regulator of aga operon